MAQAQRTALTDDVTDDVTELGDSLSHLPVSLPHCAMLVYLMSHVSVMVARHERSPTRHLHCGEQALLLLYGIHIS